MIYQVKNVSQVVAWPFEISEPSKVYVLVKVENILGKLAKSKS